MKRYFKLSPIIYLFISISSYATTQVENKEHQKATAIDSRGSIQSNVKANHQGKVEVVTFEQRSTGLSEEAKGRLTSFIASARKAGGIEGIKIAVWSDQESPVKENKDLSKDDRRLAEHRGDNLKDYLKYDLDVQKVDVFNMAEGTNWLAKVFNTEESELRSVFSKKGYKGNVSPDVSLFREYGQPSHAVIVVEQRKDGTS